MTGRGRADNDPLANGPILNLRPPSVRAATLSRQLLRLGMPSAVQCLLVEQQDPEALVSYAKHQLHYDVPRDLAEHALAEWKACNDAALAAYPALRRQVEADMARYKREHGLGQA